MALPNDGVISATSITTAEYRTAIDQVVTEVGRGIAEYVSGRTYPAGAKVTGSNGYTYKSQSAGNVGNDPTIDDGSNWRIDYDAIEALYGISIKGDYSTGLALVENDAVFDRQEALGTPAGLYVASGSFTTTDIASDVAAGDLVFWQGVTKNQVFTKEESLLQFQLSEKTLSLLISKCEALIDEGSLDQNDVAMSVEYSTGQGGGNQFFIRKAVDDVSRPTANFGAVVHLSPTISEGWYLEGLFPNGIITCAQMGAVKGTGTDNAPYIQAAFDLGITTGYEVVIHELYEFSTQVSLLNKAGLNIKSSGATHTGSTRETGLRYVGTGSADAIQMLTCESIHLDGLAIEYTDSGFTGKPLNMNGTARYSVRHCAFNGIGGVTSASYLLDLTNSIEGEVHRNTFNGCERCIFGGAASTTISVAFNDFDSYTDVAIYNPGQSWSIHNNACENKADGTGRFIGMDSGAVTYALSIANNWLGDASAATAWSWIELGVVKGCQIIGNFIDGSVAIVATAIKITGVIGNSPSGLIVRGNEFNNVLTAVDLNGSVDNFDVTGNDYGASVVNLVANIPSTLTGRYETRNGVISQGATGYNLVTPTYSTSITPDLKVGNNLQILVTDGVAFTINDPINLIGGNMELQITIVNNSGVTSGAISFGSSYRINTFGTVASGFNRTIKFQYNGAIWREISRSGDIPN